MKKGKGNRLLPNSLRIISSCIKTVSTNASTAVKSAVAASISYSSDDRKEQVLWAGFDKLELGTTATRRVLLLGYLKGFQVFDVEDASGVSELVSRRDGPVSFLQTLPYPANRGGGGGGEYKLLHPILAVVGGDVDERVMVVRNSGQGSVRYASADSSVGSSLDPPTAVRFYSMKSNEYVKVVDFSSAVFMVRCGRQVVAVGLEEQIYCFDTLTLEKKFIVVTFPVSRVREQGAFGISTCYGPMAVGPRWLAYPPSRPVLLNNTRVTPTTFASNVNQSTSSASGTLMARYAMESSKQLATGILTLGKSPSPESEYAGLVVVKDIVSLDVISHFRAHTSPISALCFDPSGALLVTASVHGNHINIFQIKPSHRDCEDWSTSYVHLYSLHRGLTSAVIQDISFSYDSAWIAVVSSRGTCHIFILSPTGEKDDSQAPSTLKLFASTPPFSVSRQSSPPRTLCAITRIRCNDSGLLNSVSNAAASVVGKTWVPTGAVAAVFHNSSSTSNTCSIDTDSSDGSLKHVLVYAPSGFVVQHEIQIPMGFEPSASKTENEESRVKVETVQWWDVCRRLDNAEREECISESNSESNDNARMIVPENVCAVKKNLFKSDSLTSLERSQWYLSNAEVQIRSCSEFIWQNPKIQFRVMECKAGFCTDGEFEIETVSSRKVEIRHRDLLPVYDHFPRARFCSINRVMPFERCPNAPDNLQAKENTYEASTIFLSNPPSFSSTESSEGGSSRRIENLLDLDHNIDRSPLHASHSPNYLNKEREGSTRIKTSTTTVGNVTDTEIMHMSSASSYEFPSEKVENVDSSSCMPSNTEKKTVYFAELLKEGYYDNQDFQVHPKPTEVVTDEVDKGGNLKEEEPHEDGWIGGMFEHSEVVTDEVDKGGNLKEEEPYEDGWIGGMFEL